MHEQALTLEIKPAEESELDTLEREFSPELLSKYHYGRYGIQSQGKGVYLIAWHNHIPVGHFLLQWSGPDDDRVKPYLDVARWAYLSAGETQVAFRRKGVATALIREAERLARAKGCTHIGLKVGSTDNPEPGTCTRTWGMSIGDMVIFLLAGTTLIRMVTPGGIRGCDLYV